MYNAIDNATYNDDENEVENESGIEWVAGEDDPALEPVSSKSVGDFSHGTGGGKRNVRTARGMS